METPTPTPLMADGTPVKRMDPTDCDSIEDVILRIRPAPLKNIEEGRKNYEYREYALRKEVKRIWLFENKPSNRIRIVLNIGGFRKPGEVKELNGVGNIEFNSGDKIPKFGYPIYDVYLLPREITMSKLKEDFGVDMKDGRQYVPQAIVDMFPLGLCEKKHTHADL